MAFPPGYIIGGGLSTPGILFAVPETGVGVQEQ